MCLSKIQLLLTQATIILKKKPTSLKKHPPDVDVNDGFESMADDRKVQMAVGVTSVGSMPDSHFTTDGISTSNTWHIYVLDKPRKIEFS